MHALNSNNRQLITEAILKYSIYFLKTEKVVLYALVSNNNSQQMTSKKQGI